MITEVYPHTNFMYYVYILKSKKDGNLYIGSTNDLKRRLDEHNNGLVFSTKSRRPFELVYRINQKKMQEIERKISS